VEVGVETLLARCQEIQEMKRSIERGRDTRKMTSAIFCDTREMTREMKMAEFWMTRISSPFNFGTSSQTIMAVPDK
jgi:hypothetical protein